MARNRADQPAARHRRAVDAQIHLPAPDLASEPRHVDANRLRRNLPIELHLDAGGPLSEATKALGTFGVQ